MKRPGYKTTEFWANLAIGILDVVSTIPFHDKAILSAIGVGYALARGFAKHGTADTIPADFVVPDTTDHPTGR